MSLGYLRNGKDLFQSLTVSLNKFAKEAEVDVASVRRIRKGEQPVLRTTANKVAIALQRHGVHVDMAKDFHESPSG